jgi:hypothetical protein
LPNTPTAYKRLSDLTAEARRAGTFPSPIDRTRAIHRFHIKHKSGRVWSHNVENTTANQSGAKRLQGSGPATVIQIHHGGHTLSYICSRRCVSERGRQRRRRVLTSNRNVEIPTANGPS